VLVLDSHNVDDLAATLVTELNSTSCEGEESVIATTADVNAGVEVSSTLTNDDFAGKNLLTTEALYAEALCVGVTTVASGARTLFMCHLSLS